MAIKFKPEFKAKWTEALRSGEYPQGKRALQVRGDSEEGYCCLGVACEITPEIVKAEYQPVRYKYRFVMADNANDWADGMPTPSMARLWVADTREYDKMGDIWHVRIPEGHKHYTEVRRILDTNQDSNFYHLPFLNDNGVPFSIIADLIDEQF